MDRTCEKEKLLSIIIPHYNSPKLLRRLLNSIPMFDCLECIVIDDHSNKELNEFGECREDFEKKGIIFLKNKLNVRSAGAARNVGLDYANGKWLAFMDADDYIIGDFEKVLKLLETQTAEIVYFEPVCINTKNGQGGRRHLKFQRLLNDYRKNPTKETELALKYNTIVPWSKLFRNDLIQKNKVRFSESLYANDVMFCVKTAYYAQKIDYSDIKFYCVTENTFGLTKEKTDESRKIRYEIDYERFCFLIGHVPIKYWKYVEINFKDVLFIFGLHFHIMQPIIKFKEKIMKDKEKTNMKLYFNEYIKKLRFQISKLLPDKIYLLIWYKRVTRQKLNLKKPKTFNEKIQWLKLYDRNPLYTKLVDKYEVREYIKNRVGDKYLIPILGIWNSVQEIDFSTLPNQFVLKCTHDSGSVIICKDKSKFDIESAKKKLRQAMKINIFYYGREWAYKKVKPRIIAEKYMVEESGDDLKDYKIYAFDGVPKVIQVDFGRFKGKHKHNFYTTNWEYRDVQVLCPSDPSIKISQPEKLQEMLWLSSQLSKGIPQVRTDFYYVGGQVYFGELTFYSDNGVAKFEQKEFAEEMGNYIHLRKYTK